MTAPTQPPSRPPLRREPRPWTDFDRLTAPRREDRVTIGAAVLLALLFHLILFSWVMPWLGAVVKTSQASAYNASRATARPPRAVEYVLTPATKEDLQTLRYVEANPNAPVAKPDATQNISNRDQRAAQPVPNPDGHSDLPATDGTQENSVKIVPGVNNPRPAPPAPPAAAPAAQTAEQSPAPATAPPPVVASTPPPALPGTTNATNGEGIRIADQPGASPAKPDTLPPRPAQETQTQRPLPPGPLTPEIVAARAAAATPATRLNAAAQTHAGPLVKNIQGTHVGGVAPALDSRLTPFGEYLSLTYEAIASAWTTRCEQFNFSPRDWGTQVEVSFVLNAQGEVEDVQVENSTASRAATLLCVNAIKTPAPFAKWPAEMRAMLGERYTLHITFYYE